MVDIDLNQQRKGNIWEVYPQGHNICTYRQLSISQSQNTIKLLISQSELSGPMKTKKYVQTIFLDIQVQFENPAFAVWGLIVFYHAHLC